MAIDSKEAEKALKSSEFRFRSLFETSIDAIVIATPDGRAFAANPAAERLFSMSQEEIVKAGRAGLMVLDEKAKQEIKKAKETGKTRVEFAYKRKDGSTFIGETTVSLFSDADGTVKTTVLIRDVSERKKAEEALKESEERYRSLFSNIGEAFALHEMLFNIDGLPVDYRFLEVNEAFERQTGLKASKIIGKTVCEILPDLEPFWIETYGKVVATGKSVRFENYNHSTDKCYEVYAFRPAKGRFGVIFNDVTTRKKNEEALKQSEAQLKVEKGKLSLIYDNASEILFSLAVEDKYRFRFTSVNKPFLDATGLQEDQIIGKTVNEVIPEPSLTLVLERYNQAINEKKTIHWEETTVYPAGKKYGEVSIAPLFDPSGLPVYLIGSVHDITERKQAEASLEEYKNHLEQLVEERTRQLKVSERLAGIGQTAGMVGHDIRNPLQAITGDLYLIQQEINENPGCTSKGITESIAAINENITYIDKIVSDLQDYTKTLKPNMATINLKEIITNELAGRKIPKNISVQVQAETNIKLETDPYFLRRILANLITNAIQSMPTGGKLTLDAFKEDKKAFICIQDSGSGIPEEVKPNLFKPLFTTKAKGQGLGLAVVKRLVEALNGTIIFESETGKGTKFTIELPLNIT